MVLIGLTGGIGSGKSTVAQVLAGYGAVVVDADQLARDVVARGTPALGQIEQHFGPEVIAGDGTLDRERLGGIVFANADQLKVLESITHPQIRALTQQRFRDAGQGAVIVHDMPLLVEQGLAGDYDLVIVVHVPQEVRVSRLVQDRGMTPAHAESRIASQASDEERALAADVVLDNSGDREQLRTAIDDLWVRRIEPMRRTQRQ